MNRVVITGIGIVSPIGNNIEEFWSNVKAGNHGIQMIDRFDTKDFPVKVAGQVKGFNPLLSFSKKELRHNDLYCQYAVEATRQAISDCGTDFKELDPYRIGVIVGSGIGGINTLESEYGKFIEKGSRRVSPFTIPMLISNMAAGTIAIKYGFKGINYALVSACATSTHTIGEAFEAIKCGRLDVCVAGGSEAAITEFTLAGFNNMKALSDSDDPDRASIPFDKDRNGFVMGEGGSILILESLENAKKRNAKIYAEVIGYGATEDAYHITSPDPTGEAACQAILIACNEGGINPSEIDYINAHGTSTPINDKYETNAIKLALKDSVNDVLISSTKSMTGHLLGAAGALEAIVCVKAIDDNFVPMTVGYKNFDPDCDLNYVVNGGIEKEVKYTISNSLGFGGHNATICIKKFEE
ncbi:beta-ketoacyl-ACP synthase II [Clostridioides sp. GD02377]|uniref:beta-ketoacyl-ACP synthase II n=1 Tax=unclassified Clostridioides TaxID=2635829 RepID=UPI0038AB5C65